MRSRQTNAGPPDEDDRRRADLAPSRCTRAGKVGEASPGRRPSRSSRRAHGWLICTGQPGGGGQSKALYVTRDGGSRWKRLLNGLLRARSHPAARPAASGYPQADQLHASAASGLLWSGRGNTLRTSDGGRHWQPVSATSARAARGLFGLARERSRRLPPRAGQRAPLGLGAAPDRERRPELAPRPLLVPALGRSRR